MAPVQDEAGTNNRGCTNITTSPSLQRLHRNHRSFQRTIETFQEPAPMEASLCHRHQWHQAQHHNPSWHRVHGCCAVVEPVMDTGHQSGTDPSPMAQTHRETSSPRQSHKHRSCTRDGHQLPHGTGTIVNHELRRCRHRAGRELWEPELNREPYGQEGLTASLQCHNGEPDPLPGCGCSCGCSCGCAMAWMHPEPPVPRSCHRQPRGTNMVKVIARSFEMRSRQDPHCGKATARDGVRCGAMIE
ncbi:uncharacterized protein [Melopsittacus undulatus]|uniref:uncharacterized protein n=1 Tax=Melopsittacus undulatus TaxID=13146 RepID=UPI00146BE326|nr:uncharacterized protein LOC117436044 [Melopsittacus undulatus]